MRVEESLGDGYVRLRVAEAERRQAKHDIRCVEDAVIELLRNSRDAAATHIFVAISRDEDIRTVTVLDDGVGIPQHMHKRVFDARVTSKLDSINMDRWGVHGRGMALYSIRVNAESCNVVSSGSGMGTSLTVRFNVNTIRERADQSTWPQVTRKGGSYQVVGPHNVVRTCVEFGLDASKSCKVYVGSPSEIVATMRSRLTALSSNEKSGLVVRQFANAEDAQRLCDLAGQVGLYISERTAYRIIRQEIRPLKNVVAQTVKSGNGQTLRDSSVPNRKLVLSDSERERLLNDTCQVFSELAGNYYMEINGQPSIRIADGMLTISIPYSEIE